MIFFFKQKTAYEITKPGLYSRVPIDIYHSQQLFDGPSVSSSGLRKLNPELGSPKHFFAEWDGNPNRKDDTDISKALIMGRALHHLVLGEPFFAKTFAVQPDEYRDPDKGNEWKKWNNNATVCKTWNEKQRKAGKFILTPNDAETIKGMAAELSMHPFIQGGALNGLIERSMFWKDKTTGIWVKVRPDSIPSDSADFFDYKTTGGKVIWREIMRACDDYGYHQQGALVRQAAREVLGLDTTQTQFTFTLIFQEKKEPYAVRGVEIKEGALDLGERQNRAALDRLAGCLKTNFWPGPGHGREGDEKIELSEYKVKQAEYWLEHPEEA